MNSIEYDAIFSSLSEAVELMNGHRSPHPEFVAALDALKQARARLTRLQDHTISGDRNLMPRLAAA